MYKARDIKEVILCRGCNTPIVNAYLYLVTERNSKIKETVIEESCWICTVECQCGDINHIEM